MIKYTLPILALGSLSLAGCPGKGSNCDTTDTTTTCDTSGSEGEGEGSGDTTPSVSVSWTTSGGNFTITNGSGDYDLGLVETDPSSPDPWTGEDCLNGYTTSSGTTYLICHPLSSTGGSLTTGTLDQLSDGGSITLFDSSYENVLTYAIWQTSSMDCYTWGADTSYYTGDGCTDIN